MNVSQMFAVQIQAVVLSVKRLFASVCLNTKELHQVYHAYRQKMHVQFQHADQTRNVRDCQME